MKTFNQTQLAEAVGVTAAHMSKILSEKQRPSWTIAKRIGEVLNADPVIFVDGSADDMRKAFLKYQLNN